MLYSLVSTLSKCATLLNGLEISKLLGKFVS